MAGERDKARRWRFSLTSLLLITAYLSMFFAAVREVGFSTTLIYASVIAALILGCLGMAGLLWFVFHDPHPIIDDRLIKQQERHAKRDKS